MTTTVLSSLNLKPTSPITVRRLEATQPAAKAAALRIVASRDRTIKTDKPYGINGGLLLKDGVDASGKKAKGKGVYQFVDKYGANVDGYSPIYNEDDWSPTGDVYTGGKTGLALWIVTLVGLLAGGALLVYNTSALPQ